MVCVFYCEWMKYMCLGFVCVCGLVCLVRDRVSVWFVRYGCVCVMFVFFVWRGMCSFC